MGELTDLNLNHKSPVLMAWAVVFLTCCWLHCFSRVLTASSGLSSFSSTCRLLRAIASPGLLEAATIPGLSIIFSLLVICTSCLHLYGGKRVIEAVAQCPVAEMHCGIWSSVLDWWKTSCFGQSNTVHHASNSLVQGHKIVRLYLVIPLCKPTWHTRTSFRLLMMLLFPTLGKPEVKTTAHGSISKILIEMHKRVKLISELDFFFFLQCLIRLLWSIKMTKSYQQHQL